MKATVTTVLDEICKVSDYDYFVTMTDTFLSGWGLAEGKTAKRVYLCKTLEIAESLVNRIQNRKNTGMKFICTDSNLTLCNKLTYLLRCSEFLFRYCLHLFCNNALSGGIHLCCITSHCMHSLSVIYF